jgi:hypothetical protein
MVSGHEGVAVGNASRQVDCVKTAAKVLGELLTCFARHKLAPNPNGHRACPSCLPMTKTLLRRRPTAPAFDPRRDEDSRGQAEPRQPEPRPHSRISWTGRPPVPVASVQITASFGGVAVRLGHRVRHSLQIVPGVRECVFNLILISVGLLEGSATPRLHPGMTQGSSVDLKRAHNPMFRFTTQRRPRLRHQRLFHDQGRTSCGVSTDRHARRVC